MGGRIGRETNIDRTCVSDFKCDLKNHGLGPDLYTCFAVEFYMSNNLVRILSNSPECVQSVEKICHSEWFCHRLLPPPLFGIMLTILFLQTRLP